MILETIQSAPLTEQRWPKVAKAEQYKFTVLGIISISLSYHLKIH